MAANLLATYATESEAALQIADSRDATRIRSRYLPSLDGWRAIAIFAVVCFHDPDSHGIGVLSTTRVHQVGWAGVDLFFAISGLLICSRLLDEEQLRGKIILRDFYIRRFFRILPAAYLFLAAALLLALLHQIPGSIPATLAAVFMVRNYWGVYSGAPPRELYTDHFWSLSVEEHFYLFLPAVLIYIRKRTAFLVAVSLLAYTWFLGFLAYGHLTNNLSLSRTDLRIHGLLIPATLALLLANPSVRQRASGWLRPWFWIGLVCLLGTALHKVNLSEKIALVSLCFPPMIASTILHPHTITCRLLESRPFRFVGRLSYGIYLWQQIFLIPSDAAAWPFSLWQHFPLNYLGLLSCAMLSYYFIEKPLIRLGHRLAPPAAPGRLDIEDSSPAAHVPRPSPVDVIPAAPVTYSAEPRPEL